MGEFEVAIGAQTRRFPGSNLDRSAPQQSGLADLPVAIAMNSYVTEPLGPGSTLHRQQTSRLVKDRLIKDLEANKFVLFSQAIASVAAPAEGPGYREILVRFQEEDNMQPPGMFLPLLEEEGLMPYLDRWVVQSTLQWIDGRGASRAPRCSVNLSPDTIRRDRHFADFVLQCLRKSGVQIGRAHV